MTKTPGTAPGPTTYYLIREDKAPKLGLRSTGGILFQVLTDEQRDKLFIRIAGNEGGGYVSDEAVPFDAIRRCVEEHDGDKPQATALKPAFVGRSSNNWGFLRTILVHEQLLRRDPDRPHLSIDTGSWDAFAARHLPAAGELKPIKVGKEVVAKKVPKAPTSTAPVESAGVDDVDAGRAVDPPADDVDAIAGATPDDAPASASSDAVDQAGDADDGSAPDAESTQPGKPAAGRLKGRGKGRASPAQV